MPGALKCFSDSLKGGSVSCEGIGGFVSILPRASHSQHHPRAYQAEHFNIFTSLIETGQGKGEISICLLFPLLLMSKFLSLPTVAPVTSQGLERQ